MPCRSWIPDVLIRKPAAARPPSTVGPCHPTVACAATPGGLSTATMSSSEYRIVHAFDLDGRILHRRRRFRQPHLQPRTRRQLVGLARAGAVDVDAAVLGQRGGGRPGQAEQPRQPGVDAHSRQPLGDRHRAGRHYDVVGLAAADRIEVKTEQRQDNQQDRPAHHGRVGDVEHRPPADGQEIHDMALQRSRRAEEPVDQVAHRAAEDHAEADGPPRRDQPPAHPDDADHHTGGDQREDPGVAGGHRERGAGVAHQCPGDGVADDRHRLARCQQLHREHLGDDVEHQHHRRDGEQQAQPRFGAGCGASPSVTARPFPGIHQSLPHHPKEWFGMIPPWVASSSSPPAAPSPPAATTTG